MDELTSPSPDDADAELARRIGEGNPALGHDAFERLLVTYRGDARAVVPPQGFSERLWARVVVGTSVRRSPLRILPLWTRWAAAAAAMILVALAFWFARGPVLLASSEAEIATVSLDDGSVVSMRPHTTLYRSAPNVYLLKGEAFFDVAHRPERNFTVRSELGEVRVLGTRFDVSTWGNETSVYLERGSVVFEHLATGALDTLAPGDELMASATRLLVAQSLDGGRGALDWMNGALVFGERPLMRIVAEMEHHFDITVLVPDSLKTETLSGQIFLSTPEESLRDLGTALGGRFEEKRPNVFDLSFD